MNVLILACSKKEQEYCVAGKNIDSPTQWIRLVTNVNGNALSFNKITTETGHTIAPLDVVTLENINSAPLFHQPENYVLNSPITFTETKYTIDQLQNFVDSPANLWGNNSPYISQRELNNNKPEHSLYLINVSNLQIRYTEPSTPSTKPKTKASFTYNGVTYNNFSVTDPSIRENLNIEKAILCISLAGSCTYPDKVNHPDWPRHYKIVAKVFYE